MSVTAARVRWATALCDFGLFTLALITMQTGTHARAPPRPILRLPPRPLCPNSPPNPRTPRSLSPFWRQANEYDWGHFDFVNK